MLTCPAPSFDKLHCRHFLQGRTPAQLQLIEWKISNPVVSLFPRLAVQPHHPAACQLVHTATAGSSACASLQQTRGLPTSFSSVRVSGHDQDSQPMSHFRTQQNAVPPGGIEDMRLGSQQACSASYCTIADRQLDDAITSSPWTKSGRACTIESSRTFSSRLHASMSEACESSSPLQLRQHTSSQPGWGIDSSSTGEATGRMLSSTLSDALPQLLRQGSPGHACTDEWPAGSRADQPASCSSSVNGMSAALRHGPHPPSTPPSDSRPSHVHPSGGLQGLHCLDSFGTWPLGPKSSTFVGLSNAHEQSWQARAGHTSMQARCYSSQLGKSSDTSQQRMQSSTQSSMQQPKLSPGSALGGPAGPNATSFRPASSTAGPKRIQDKVVTDPSQISGEEVRVVHEDGGHEIKSPTEAFKLATR